MKNQDVEFYLSQLRAYYQEVIIFLIMVIIAFFKAPIWVPFMAWGISLLWRAKVLNVFNIWGYINEWERRKTEEFQKKYDKDIKKEAKLMDEEYIEIKEEEPKKHKKNNHNHKSTKPRNIVK
jgi:hypothetical protein